MANNKKKSNRSSSHKVGNRYVLGVDLGVMSFATVVVWDSRDEEMVFSSSLSSEVEVLRAKTLELTDEVEHIQESDPEADIRTLKSEAKSSQRAMYHVAATEISEIAKKYGAKTVAFEAFPDTHEMISGWFVNEVILETAAIHRQVGGEVVRVSHYRTSKECHACGSFLTMQARTAVCREHGRIDRDVNAAANVAKRAIFQTEFCRLLGIATDTSYTAVSSLQNSLLDQKDTSALDTKEKMALKMLKDSGIAVRSNRGRDVVITGTSKRPIRKIVDGKLVATTNPGIRKIDNKDDIDPKRKVRRNKYKKTIRESKSKISHSTKSDSGIISDTQKTSRVRGEKSRRLKSKRRQGSIEDNTLTIIAVKPDATYSIKDDGNFVPSDFASTMNEVKGEIRNISKGADFLMRNKDLVKSSLEFSSYSSHKLCREIRVKAKDDLIGGGFIPDLSNYSEYSSVISRVFMGRVRSSSSSLSKFIPQVKTVYPTDGTMTDELTECVIKAEHLNRRTLKIRSDKTDAETMTRKVIIVFKLGNTEAVMQFTFSCDTIDSRSNIAVGYVGVDAYGDVVFYFTPSTPKLLSAKSNRYQIGLDFRSPKGLYEICVWDAKNKTEIFSDAARGDVVTMYAKYILSDREGKSEARESLAEAIALELCALSSEFGGATIVVDPEDITHHNKDSELLAKVCSTLDKRCRIFFEELNGFDKNKETKVSKAMMLAISNSMFPSKRRPVVCDVNITHEYDAHELTCPSC